MSSNSYLFLHVPWTEWLCIFTTTKQCLGFSRCFINDAMMKIGGSDSKESACNVGDPGSISWDRKIPWRREWQPTSSILDWKIPWTEEPGRLYSPWGLEESDTTEGLHFHFHFHALEKAMATHSSVLAWRIPGTGEPGRLLSMGSHRVRHDWSDLAAAAAAAASSKNFHQETKLLLKTFFNYNSSSYWSGNY